MFKLSLAGLTNASSRRTCSSRCNMKADSAAILAYQHWQVSPVAFESRKCDTSRLVITPRASPATIGNESVTHSTNKKQFKVEEHISDCSGNNIGEREVNIGRWLVSTLAIFQ
jgi:hypothetical protein